VNPQEFNNWLAKKRHLDEPLSFIKPLIMGVLNVTTDSFSDGGKFLSFDRSCEHAFELIAQGADLIDIGGESTRPGATPVSVDQELARVIPLIEYIHSNSDVCISIDTYKPEVMSQAIAAGANLINDIYALRYDGALSTAAKLNVPICLMHMQGQPYNMQKNPQYPQGLMAELCFFFRERIQACLEAGIAETQLLLDPGFGFGKRVVDNLHMMRYLNELNHFNMPLLLGVSRKHTIGVILDKKIDQRLIGSVALAVFAAIKGAGILRTHDVDETKQAIQIIEAIYQAE
jgi:dihydropteroate synthase